jgi:hypothetical protein
MLSRLPPDLKRDTLLKVPFLTLLELCSSPEFSFYCDKRMWQERARLIYEYDLPGTFRSPFLDYLVLILSILIFGILVMG